jgi:hypothetical protein
MNRRRRGKRKDNCRRARRKFPVIGLAEAFAD